MNRIERIIIYNNILKISIVVAIKFSGKMPIILKIFQNLTVLPSAHKFDNVIRYVYVSQKSYI